MKTLFKTFFLLSLMACSIAAANAQFSRKKFTSDIHVGLNLAEMHNTGGLNENTKLKPGLVLGVNFNYKFLRNIQLQTGFYVSKKGLKQENHTVEETALLDRLVLDTVQNTVANYVQIPLCIGYEVYLTKQFAVNINAGLYGAYGFKGRYEHKYSKTLIDYDGSITREPLVVHEGETFDVDRWRRWDYGLMGSVGFIYDIFTINFNYEYGLNDVSIASWETLRNRNVSVLLGVRF